MRTVWRIGSLLAVALSLGCSADHESGPSGSSGVGPASGAVAGAIGSASSGTSGAEVADAASAAVNSDAGADASLRSHGDAGADARAASHEAGADATVVDGAAGESSDAAPVCGGQVLGGGPVTTDSLHLDIGVHDPSMIWDGKRYFLFATGGTLGMRSSPDMFAWTNAGNVLSAVPAWVTTALGSTPTDLWAPDISYFNGQFHVYYAGSTFGSNDSVIGLATTSSLEPPAFTDQGVVVQSTTSDDFNAIDPNVSFDQNCAPWLAYGSFWSGIKLRKLDAVTGKLATDDTKTYSLAARSGTKAIEAASIVSHNGYYYLFVSFDACCKGVNSTYRTMMGRATQITGPYVDKTGASMTTGAAEQLLATAGRYIGPGGGTAWKDGQQYLYVYHYYDGDDNGASKLQVRPIAFDADDWVTLGDPLFP